MPRAARTLDAVLQQVVADTIARVVASARRKPGPARLRGGPPRRRRRARRAGELTRWVADRRARRVPSFVIAMTGLDTKKKIVARYGASAAFEVGKPPPRVRAEVVRAAPPTVRKAAALR